MKKYCTFPFIVRIGLACVFLANSLTAFLDPGEFQDLVSASVVAHLLPVSVATFITFVAVHDFTVAALLGIGWRTSYVATYASLWLVGVITLIVGPFSLDALEHLGFLSMSTALALHERAR